MRSFDHYGPGGPFGLRSRPAAEVVFFGALAEGGGWFRCEGVSLTTLLEDYGMVGALLGNLPPCSGGWNGITRGDTPGSQGLTVRDCLSGDGIGSSWTQT